GKRLRLVSPEDLLIIKAAAHSELTPGHWHDAIALLTHASLDWDYLIRRARRAPRRILSLLLYAQSNDVWVPNYVIDNLYQVIFGTRVTPSIREERVSHPGRGPSPYVPFVAPAQHSGQPISGGAIRIQGAYAVAHLRERLAEDPRTNELDIQIEQ